MAPAPLAEKMLSCIELLLHFCEKSAGLVWWGLFWSPVCVCPTRTTQRDWCCTLSSFFRGASASKPVSSQVDLRAGLFLFAESVLRFGRACVKPKGQFRKN